MGLPLLDVPQSQSLPVGAHGEQLLVQTHRHPMLLNMLAEILVIQKYTKHKVLYCCGDSKSVSTQISSTPMQNL